MNNTLGLFFVIFFYSITIFFFGMWVQKTADNWQLKKFTDAAWTEGCKTCAKFEDDKCKRDELQGMFGVTQIP